MTLDKAIKINTEWLEGKYNGSIKDLFDARRLGIEALKVVKDAKIVGHYGLLYPLPGETE